MKVNEKRKQMYHNGEVGIQYNADNSGDRLERLNHVTECNLIGNAEVYGNSITFHPLSWFFEPDTERKPTAWRLKIDVPEWGVKQGTEHEAGEFDLPNSILSYIATPIYTTPFTLESGQQVELSDTDINNIKLLP